MKEILKVKGGISLTGEVSIGGAKNSLVALIPASIITKSMVKLENVMPIDDTYTLISILKKLNVSVLYDDKSILYIDARKIKNVKLDNEDMKKMRASYYFMGALLSLFNKVEAIGPGGCNFCNRPIDLHLFSFSNLGFKYDEKDGVYSFYKCVKPAREFTFEKKSVGATINAILASCRTKGKIKINNCSLEPEIDDLINFLNKCGCSIIREKESIIVEGRSKLQGCSYTVMPDRIEAGTFMIIGACLGNHLKIKNIDIGHLKNVIQVLERIGVEIVCKNDCLIVNKKNSYRGIDIEVLPYPGFPTDLQQPLSVLLSLCSGDSIIKETIYPARLSQIESLNKMNALINVEDDVIKICGNRKFLPSEVDGKDLRGGISLVIAGLIANGESLIGGVKYIKRGYSDLVRKLRKIGADVRIERIERYE